MAASIEGAIVLKCNYLQLVSTLVFSGLAALPSLATSPLDISTPVGEVIYSMPENSWAKLNKSRFDSSWARLDQRPSFGPTNPAKIIKAWSSMAWDSNRGKLMFFGGGHSNYAGNEVYLWNSNTGYWERGSLPSEVEPQPIDPELKDLISSEFTRLIFRSVDGVLNSPVAAHTYDNSEFLPLADRFVSLGGASFETGRQWVYFTPEGGLQQTGPYMWNPAKAHPWKVSGLEGSQVKPDIYTSVHGGEMWENRNNVVSIKPTYVRNDGIFPNKDWKNGTSDYSDENPDADVMYFSDTNELFRYTVVDVEDPAEDIWEQVGERGVNEHSGQGAGTYDSRLNIYVRTWGSPSPLKDHASIFGYWDLNTTGSGKVRFDPEDSSGEFNLGALENFGMDYDPKRDQYILWGGADEVWALVAPQEVSTAGWTLTRLYDYTVDYNPELPTTTVPGVVPNILGKWKYIPEYDIYLGVHSAEGEIWAYKPANWMPNLGPIVDSIPPGVTITAPGSGAEITGTGNFRVEALDDRLLEVVRFYVNNVEVGEDTTPPYEIPWDSTPFPQGAANLTARAFDGTGNEGISEAIPVTIENIPTSSSTSEIATGDASVDNNWQTVAMANTVNDAVIIAAPPSANDLDPGVARLRNVSATHFELRFEEWDYRNRDFGDSTHGFEKISYLAMQPGRYTMLDGTIIEVGTLSLSGDRTWKTQHFTKKLPGMPKLFLTVQTQNDQQVVAVRARGVTNSRFRAALFEEEALNDGHGVEVVGYLAIYSPSGSGALESMTQTIPFRVESVATTDAWKPVGDYQIRLEEEQSADAETAHLAETVHILHLDTSMFAQDVTSKGSNSAAIRSRAN